MVNLDRLQDLMVERGWKAPYVCKQLGSSRYRIADWKRGKNLPTEAEVEILAHLFLVSKEYLEGKTDIKNPVTNEGDGFREKAMKFYQVFLDNGIDPATLTEADLQAVSVAFKSLRNKQD